MTVLTTDHIRNCSTSNSNSEHSRRTTRFTRISEIQLTSTPKPPDATNYRFLITDHILWWQYGYTTDYCTSRRYAPAPTDDATRSRQMYVEMSRQRMITEYHYCQYAHTRNDAEGSLKGFKIICDGCMRTCVNHVSPCAVHVLRLYANASGYYAQMGHVANAYVCWLK